MTSTTLELLRKYSVPGPRYTSYPTAPYFRTDFSEADWVEELAAPAADRGLSLYAHIPFCDTLCHFCGCNMVATRDYNKTQPYLGCLDKEMARTAQFVDAGRTVQQLHWGGGTPTYLHPEDIRRLMGMMRQHFTLAADAEVSCEIDPRELTREHLVALRESGFNRVSFGVQDMDPAVQQAVDTAQVDERAVVGDVLDHALDDCAFLEVLHDRFTVGAHAGLQHRAARNHHVVALAVQLDDLQLHGLVFVRRGVLDRTDVDQRARQERADAVDHRGQAALDLAADEAFHDLAFFHGHFEVVPCSEALGLFALQLGLAIAVLQRLDRDGDEVARLDFELTLGIEEFLDRDQTFGLQSGIHDHHVVVDTHDLCGNQFAGAHFLARQAFFEHCGETIGVLYSGCSCGCVHRIHLRKILPGTAVLRRGLVSDPARRRVRRGLFLRSCLKNCCGGRLRRCAVLAILMYSCVHSGCSVDQRLVALFTSLV